ncbi:glycosyltransferase [Kineococcus arenarius]|uniref:glycosyltransferase n=1 Tax=Kineococcus sp. SYSU DK007 TaxID=3383128 RepID=UPI003D7D40C0
MPSADPVIEPAAPTGAAQPADVPLGPVAYLVSQYPTTSHTFIETEIEALRARGVEVHTFTVRTSPPEQQRSERSRREAERTTALQGRGRAAVTGIIGEALHVGPRAVLAGAGLAARSGRTARARTWQAFYLSEALLLLAELRTRGVRHVHVHFANNSADIARLVVRMGRALEGPGAGWRWTLSMHGPTEFEAVEAVDLPAKVRSADAVACISDFCRAQLMRHSDPGHWDKLHLVRMGVDADRFADASAERAARAPGPLRVLFVGRLVPEKGPSVLLDAIAQLRRRAAADAVQARIVGAGPLESELRRRVRELGLQDVVELLGALPNEELPKQYRWADAFCLPSFAEGVPVVLMEAMATGLPVVTTPVAGIPELVRDGENGFLVPPGRADALADALLVLAADERLRRRAGAAGRARVVEEFDPALNADRLVRALSTGRPG